jgi:hypothetical protein
VIYAQQDFIAQKEPYFQKESALKDISAVMELRLVTQSPALKALGLIKGGLRIRLNALNAVKDIIAQLPQSTNFNAQ